MLTSWNLWVDSHFSHPFLKQIIRWKDLPVWMVAKCVRTTWIPWLNPLVFFFYVGECSETRDAEFGALDFVTIHSTEVLWLMVFHRPAGSSESSGFRA